MGSSLALAGVGYRAVQPVTAQSPLRGGVLAGEQSAIVLKSLADLARYSEDGIGALTIPL